MVYPALMSLTEYIMDLENTVENPKPRIQACRRRTRN